jgi:S-DNA-T family DNA segregation ATPase FtsK/SpoIIIE
MRHLEISSMSQTPKYREDSEPIDAQIVPFPGRGGPVLDGEVIDAEVVGEESGEVGTLVDDPSAQTSGDGWLSSRRAYLESAPSVIPSYLRDRSEFFENARFVARYYRHVAGFHAARTPVYLLRLMSRSPRGTVRLTHRWWLWVTDAEARPVVAKAAANADPAAWMHLSAVQTKRTGPRKRVSIVVAVPAGFLIMAAAVLLPGWALAAVAAGLASRVAGKDPDKPIVQRYVSVHVMRPLASPEVEAALMAIGVKGDVDWPEPIQTDGPGWRAEIDLPPGALATTVLEKRAELAGAMRRPLGTVWPGTDTDAHPGRLVLWVAKQDPAKTPRRLWPLLRSGTADLFEPVPFGFGPRGRLVTIPLMYSNLIMGGVPGSGKTSAVLAIAAAGALDVRTPVPAGSPAPHSTPRSYERRSSPKTSPSRSGDVRSPCAPPPAPSRAKLRARRSPTWTRPTWSTTSTPSGPAVRTPCTHTGSLRRSPPTGPTCTTRGSRLTSPRRR